MSADESGPGGVSEDCEYIRAESEPDVVKKLPIHVFQVSLRYRNTCYVATSRIGTGVPSV